MASKIIIEKSQIKIITKLDMPEIASGKAIIRIGEEAYNKLVKLSDDTGLSITKLATAAIDFALNKVVVIEREAEKQSDV